jgi:OmpA-OmpF porin, OOP family
MINKHLKISFLFTILSIVTSAQKFDSPKKGPVIGFSFNLVDFSASVPKIGKVDPGLSLMYWKGLSNKIDFSARYNGLFSNYVKDNSNSEDYSAPDSKGYINELEGSLHGRILNDNHLLNPFLTAGIGIGSYGKEMWATYVPLGGGLQLNMFSEGYIFLQANYRRSLNEKRLDHNMFYSLGFTQSLRDKKTETPKEIPVAVAEVKDSDNDGVPDVSDHCPDAAGLTALNGCPDKDSDGLADKDDACPDRAGLQKYKGCTVPDTDKDGINDEQDKCVQVAGIAKYDGCPVPDTDSDGVNDEEDKCPRLAGVSANNGCPEIKEEVKKRIEKAALQIYFAPGSAKLLAKSNKSLEEVVNILQTDIDLKLDINGHTDNTGKADKNLVLSENRAKAVYDYLLKKGISEDKLKSSGFGQDQPVAENKTAAGRTKNRRVELVLHYNE